MIEYNHPQCPKCESNINVVKNGEITRRKKKEIIKLEQRYFCKNCDINFFKDTINTKADKHRQALMMYLEGMRYSEIGKFLDVDSGTVKKWFNTYGIDLRAIQPLRNSRKKATKQIEKVFAIAVSNDTDGYKPKSFNDGFIILEKENRVHISFLKENHKYKMELRNKSITKKENNNKRIIGRNDLLYGI